MRILLFIAIFIFNSVLCEAQNIIEIKIVVVDTLNNPIDNAFITIENKIRTGLNFTRTDSNGHANISLESEEGFFLKVTAPDFESYRTPLSENQNEYRIILRNLSKSLPEIKVKGRKGPHIVSKGDSLFYTVKDFESRADRTIGDILGKIPGIEVKSDGSISFRGKMIGSLYIDGDDLLGQRYGLATNTIQSSMVDSIQVIDNDQHIKVLQGIEEGKSPSINLVLKPKARTLWTNVAEVKAGIPSQFSGKLSNMALRPSFKTLNILTGNNSGKDLNEDFNVLTASSAKPWEELNNSQNILNDNKISFSELPSSRWLFNKGIMASVNTLIKLKPDQSLTVNAGYMYQKDDEYFSEQSTYFLPNDTVSIFNKNDNIHSNAQLFAGIKSTINNNRKFLNNEFQIQGNRITNSGITNSNNDQYSIWQRFSGINISNRLSSIQLIRKRFITEISSVVQYENNPEQMHITPGTLYDVLNAGHPYFQSSQNVEFEKIYTSNSFGIKFIGNHLYQKYNVGFSYLNQWLGSGLNLLDENHNIESPGNNYNDRGNFQYFSPFIYSEWNLELGRKTLSGNLLSTVPVFQYEDDLISSTLHQARLQLTPTLAFRTKVGKENKFDLTGSLNNSNNDIYSLYRGSVLKDYRTVSSQSLPLDNSVDKNIATRFDFQKSLQIFFANIGARYSVVNSHWIYKTAVSDKISVMEAIPFENKKQNLSYFGGFSKYLFFLRTNIEFAYNGMYSKGIQFQNEETFPVTNYHNTFRGGLQKGFGKIAEIFYKISYSEFYSKYSINNILRNNSFTEWNHSVKINITPKYKWLINVEFQDQKLKQNNSNSSFLFVDAKARYTIEKLKLDINFGITNITGQKKIENLILTENILYNSVINLRPRTFYISTYFNF